MKKKLSVAFLWHMHQPLYKDLVTGKYYLPWVRLHSTYSYLDMAAVIAKYPRARATFNFTPSLIRQLLDFSNEGHVDDVFLELSEKNAGDLSEEDMVFILKNFFSCDAATAILPIKRYGEIYALRGDGLRAEELSKKAKDLSVQDFRDLQVFFNLAWCGFTLKEKDPVVKSLLEKGSGYSEDEKKALLKRQKEVVASILPTYKRLQDDGIIEISTTPYYHPIMPLLCRGKSGAGFQFYEDAKVQVEKAVELYREVFGRAPVGMWPSEGSVSQEVIPVFEDADIKWLATDEGVLLESFKGEDIPREDLIYRAFTAEEDGKHIDMVFRDINISNAVSFRYSALPPHKAFADLFRDITGIKKAMEKRPGDHIVSIILDGENPWPYFPDGGKGFLEETYASLSAQKDVELVTIASYLERCGEKKKIKKLYSGSWINRNFDKWIGSPQKNKAWEYLAGTRKELFASGTPSKEALEELYIAEGSDWFWWYDDFGTELNFIFDELFRMHLANIYKLMGRDVPYYLKEPVPSGPVIQRLPDFATPATMGRFPRVLFVSSEVTPFAKTGGLADVSGSLPKSLVSMGCDVRVIMPLYKCIDDAGIEMEKEADHIDHPFQPGMYGFDLYSNKSAGVTTWFIRNEKRFDRDGLYSGRDGDYPDNGLRFAFFSKAALSAVKEMGFSPDVIHCNDWQSALIPFYLRFGMKCDAYYRNVRTLFTIHNLAYQGIFDKSIMKRIGISEDFFHMGAMEFYGKVNFMKSGILYSDAVNTVSHRYAEEIMTSEYGCGLDGLMRTRKDVLYGIPNGVDYSVWSPRNDRFIRANYDAGNIEKKQECKKDLLEHTGIRIAEDKPLIGCVSRFAEQKGMGLLTGIAEKIVDLGAALAVLGNGNKFYGSVFTALAEKYPGKIFVYTGFNEELAHKIEAGCDMFVMPSIYEPCGLNQMYSIKYGTIPIVRATGGLDDVVVDFDADRENGNGFKFRKPEKDAFYEAVSKAVRLYGDKALWKKLMLRAMAYDFSWERSAEQYMCLYRKLMS
ncbi:MAG: glycogen synthase GlgA [Candidatus Omnitrophota bacterium]